MGGKLNSIRKPTLGRRKSGREKLENHPEGLPEVVTVPSVWQKRVGAKRLLVQTPLKVDALVRKVNRGELVTVGQLASCRRFIKSDVSLKPKFPARIKKQAERLREEGHKIVRGKGEKPLKVKDFEEVLA